jgi:hypothetical protein
MKDFKTSLLREKFTIRAQNAAEEPIIALSNRIKIDLISPDKIDNESFVIRTQNMHSCAKMAGAVVKEFYERGSLIGRAQEPPWKFLWNDVMKGYERSWNPDIWCAVYHNGRVLYEFGKRHPFLDIIEQCDANNLNSYSQSMRLAEDIFAQAGKKVVIDHDSNIALVVQVEQKIAKAGIIVRAATGTTTFNFTTKTKEGSDQVIHPFTTLSVSASYLEAIQLAFKVGFMIRKKEYGLIARYSDEDRHLQRAEKRLSNLALALNRYDAAYSVFYRPDKPNFAKMQDNAKEFAAKLLKPEVEEKIAEGELDPKDWVI